MFYAAEYLCSNIQLAAEINIVKIDWNALFVVLNLVILYILLKCFLWKPICKAMDARKAKIDEQFKSADEAQKNAADLKEEYQNKISEINRESEKMLAEAKDDARSEYGRIVGDANEEARRILNKAHTDIENEKADAFRTLKGEIASTAITAAEKILQKEISELDNIRIYDEFLKENGESNEPDNL